MNRVMKISTGFLVILIPILTSYYVNRSAPDVRYNLSEKIPVTFANPANSSPETVQQVEVKNIGNAKAAKVVVKIAGQLTAYSI